MPGTAAAWNVHPAGCWGAFDPAHTLEDPASENAQPPGQQQKEQNEPCSQLVLKFVQRRDLLLEALTLARREHNLDHFFIATREGVARASDATVEPERMKAEH